MSTDAATSRRGTGGGRKAGGIVILIILICAALGAIYVVGAPFADQAGQKWITCEVESAQPASGGSKTPVYSVRLSTSCGKLQVDHGVTADNVNATARSFIESSKYSFKVGWLSRVSLRIGMTATAREWHRVGS